MKIAFLTENGFQGKVPSNHINMRVEMAWIVALDADHYNIHNYRQVKGYDAVLIIFPKCTTSLSSDGSQLIHPNPSRNISIYSEPIISTLKENNNKLVCNVQEGSTNYNLDWEVKTQFEFFNILSECDILFSHNEYDKKWYKGLFPTHRVETIPSLLIEDLIQHIIPEKKEECIIGGNFSKWYNGFISYLVADEFQCPKFIPSMHCKRDGEENIEDLTVMPYMNWFEWMKRLSKFKYAIHLMDTVAAGTFSLNNAYFGIPCIGNEKVDTQRLCFPDLSVDVNDIESARKIAKKLRIDRDFYNEVSAFAVINYRNHFHGVKFKKTMHTILTTANEQI